MQRNELVSYLDTYLDITGIDDHCCNGLEIEGSDEIKKVTCAVDACIDSFRHAAAAKADMLIVHHGQFWQHVDPSLTTWNKERINMLLENDISLYAAHLPLDRHKQVGNNAQLLKLLDASIDRPFYFRKDKNIGWIGKTKKPLQLADIATILNTKLQTQSTVIPFGDPAISTIAVVSGGGGYGGFRDALKEDIDLYISGDAIDIYQTAKDAKMNVIFAGHYATETVGPKALADHIKDRFKLETEFINLPTGL